MDWRAQSVSHRLGPYGTYTPAAWSKRLDLATKNIRDSSGVMHMLSVQRPFRSSRLGGVPDTSPVHENQTHRSRLLTC